MAARQSALGKRSNTPPRTSSKEEAPLSSPVPALGYKSVPTLLGLVAQGLRSGLVGTWEEAPPGPVESLESQVGLGVFFKCPLLLGVATRGCPSDPDRAEALEEKEVPTHLFYKP